MRWLGERGGGLACKCWLVWLKCIEV
jgi:hypothetical protein